MDNHQMERIVQTWRTGEKRQCGIGEMEGWRDIRWREDRGLWLVWSEPRVRLAESIRRFVMPMKRRLPRRPVLSVLAQVGTSCHILLTFLMTFAFFRLLSTSEVVTSELVFHSRSSSAFQASVQKDESLKAFGNYGVHRQSSFLKFDIVW